MTTEEPATYMRCDICKAPYMPHRKGYVTTTYEINHRHYVQVHTARCPLGWQPKGTEDD